MENVKHNKQFEEPAEHSVQLWRPLIIAFVLSAVMLAYEIMLTRVASVLLTNQYVFLIIGVSLLGISIGAIIEYFIARNKNESAEAASRVNDTFPAIGIMLTVLSLAAAILLILKVGPSLGTLAIASSAALPFAASGFVFSKIFRVYTQHTSILYGADLFGAAAGAL